MRFAGFPNAETWSLYTALVRQQPEKARRWLLAASKLPNKAACDFLQKAVTEAVWASLGQGGGRGDTHMAQYLIDNALHHVVWGELLVSLKWHFDGREG